MAGVLSSFDFILGPGGSAALGFGERAGENALANFDANSGRVGAGLTGFQGFNTSSAFGNQRFFEQEGEFNLSQDSPLFAGILDEFNTNAAAGSGGILELLRQRAAPGNARQFAQTEAGVLNTGRLGLSVGDRGGIPEFDRLFAAQNQQDLGFQLEAEQQFSQGQAGLLSELQQIQGFLSADVDNVLSSQQTQSQRDIAAGNLEQAGLTTLLQGRLGQAGINNSLFGGAISSLGVGPVSATF